MNDIATHIAVQAQTRATSVHLVLNHPRPFVSYLLAHLALHGPVDVLSADSRLTKAALVRLIRRQTLEVEQTLDRIEISFISRCFQIPTLIPLMRDDRPLVILKLLSVFRQEGIEMQDARRLLSCLLMAVGRREAPTIIVVQPPTRPEDQVLLDAIVAAADQRHEWLDGEADQAAQQLELF